MPPPLRPNWPLALCLGVVLALPWPGRADTFLLPPDDVDLVGEVYTVRAKQEDTLLDIAREHGIGQLEILLANPEVDRWLPGAGTEVVIPHRFILPDAPREGIVLNVPEMRLYYYPKPRKGEPREVVTHPVSIGRMDWSTPLGTTRIVTKVKDPAWRPPRSIKEEAKAQGNELPDVVPAGPDNPLGRYAMRLGIPGYLIHSTNKPYGVGMRVTHGCVRMYPEDIEAIFDRVPVGTKVTIVNQPVKVGWFADTLYIEVHPPLEEDEVEEEGLEGKPDPTPEPAEVAGENGSQGAPATPDSGPGSDDTPPQEPPVEPAVDLLALAMELLRKATAERPGLVELRGSRVIWAIAQRSGIPVDISLPADQADAAPSMEGDDGHPAPMETDSTGSGPEETAEGGAVREGTGPQSAPSRGTPAPGHALPAKPPLPRDEEGGERPLPPEAIF